MICYITKSRAQLNSPLFLFSLILPSCLLVVHAFIVLVIIAFVSSHFSALYCQSIAIEYTLFYTSIKSLLSYFTKLLVIFIFVMLAVFAFVFSDFSTLRRL